MLLQHFKIVNGLNIIAHIRVTCPHGSYVKCTYIQCICTVIINCVSSFLIALANLCLLFSISNTLFVTSLYLYLLRNGSCSYRTKYTFTFTYSYLHIYLPISICSISGVLYEAAQCSGVFLVLSLSIQFTSHPASKNSSTRCKLQTT